MNGIVGVGAIIMGVVVFGLLLLLGRELVAWYLKVNQALDQLERLEVVLRNIDKNLIVLADNSEEKR